MFVSALLLITHADSMRVTAAYVLYLSGVMFVVVTAATEPLTTSTSSPAATSTQSPLTDVPDLFQTAVFTCVDKIFKDELSMVFPPSDAVIDLIANVSKALNSHRKSVKKFCKNIDTYTQCVVDAWVNGSNPGDRIVGQYIDMAMFKGALQSYCNNQRLVTDQFQCMQGVVTSGGSPCRWGGIYGMIQGVYYAASTNLPRAFFCSERLSTLACRKAQMEQCDPTFANVMNTIYVDLTAKYCADTGAQNSNR